MNKLEKIAKIFEGVSSVIFLFPSKNSRQLTLPKFSISSSLENDWKKIGHDMWQACRLLDPQQLKIQRYKDNKNDEPARSSK